MTAREYAKANDIEIVGKLTKKVVTHEKFDFKKCELVEVKIVFYIDEAGNEFHKAKNSWCIITADGVCI